MHIYKKIFIIVFIHLPFTPSISCMDYAYVAANWVLKKISLTYNETRLVDKESHSMCQRLKEQGLELSSERILDDITYQELYCFSKRKRDACNLIIDLLGTGDMTTLQTLYNINKLLPHDGLPREFLPLTIKLFALRQLVKFKITKEQERALFDQHLYDHKEKNSILPHQINERAIPSSTLTINTNCDEDPDKGFVHNFNKWASVDYAVKNLCDQKITEICKKLREQSLTIPHEQALDQETCRLLAKFTRRCYNTSVAMIELLKIGNIKKISDFYYTLSTKNPDILCSVIELYAVRSAIQRHHSLKKEEIDIDNRIQNTFISHSKKGDDQAQIDKKLLQKTLEKREQEEDETCDKFINMLKTSATPALALRSPLVSATPASIPLSTCVQAGSPSAPATSILTSTSASPQSAPSSPSESSACSSINSLFPKTNATQPAAPITSNANALAANGLVEIALPVEKNSKPLPPPPPAKK